MRKIKLSILLIGMCVFVTACGQNRKVSENVQQGSIIETIQNNDKVKDADLESEYSEEINNQESYTIERQKVNTNNLLKPNDSILMDGILYQLTSYELTQKFGDRNKATLCDWLGELIDNETKDLITDEYKYLFTTITIENQTDSTKVICRAPGIPVMIETDMSVYSLGESIYIDSYWNGGSASEVFFYELNPGESITAESGYLVNLLEQSENGTLSYAIQHSSDWSDKENIFYELELVQ